MKTYMKAGRTKSITPELEDEALVVVNVLMLEKEKTQDCPLVFWVNQITDDHLFNSSIHNSRKILCFHVQKHHTYNQGKRLLNFRN